MRGPLILRVYILAVIAAAVIICAVAGVRFGLPLSMLGTPQPWMLLVLVALAMRFPLLLPPGTRFGTKFDVATVAVFAATLLYPPPISSIVVVGGTMVPNVVLHRQWYVVLFNMAQYAISVTLAGWVFYAIRGGMTIEATLLRTPVDLWAAFVAAVVLYFSNTFLVAVVTGFQTRRPILSLWVQQRRHDVVYETVLMLLALSVVLTAESAPWGIVLAATPAAGVYYAFRRGLQHFQEARRLIEDLADVIEGRLPRARGHTRRVAELAMRLGTVMGYSQEEVETVRAAALVHDIGMLNVGADEAHSAPPLEPRVAEAVRRHPMLGAKIVGRSPLYVSVAPLVAAHHERWDGSGYPRGLEGEAIPPGARILAVADAWDGLLYGLDGHEHHAPGDAYQAIVAERGTGYDPAVVDALLSALNLRQAERVTRTLTPTAAGTS